LRRASGLTAKFIPDAAEIVGLQLRDQRRHRGEVGAVERQRLVTRHRVGWFFSVTWYDE
jgi:hypothetical protein